MWNQRSIVLIKFPLPFSAIYAAEEVVPEEDDNEENPFSTEFLEDQEAAYLKDPKKALQGFYDREGEITLLFQGWPLSYM